jgi:NADPH2:quinone reductase
VITTISSPAKATLAKAAGAHSVVDYRETDAALVIRRSPIGTNDPIVENAPTLNRLQ